MEKIHRWCSKIFIYSILKLTKKEIIIIIAIAVPLITVILALLIKYRKHFDLGNNPIEYTNILFDCYAIFEIYTGVGFFIYQLIKLSFNFFLYSSSLSYM